MNYTNEGQELHTSSTVPSRGAVMAIYPLESHLNITITNTCKNLPIGPLLSSLLTSLCYYRNSVQFRHRTFWRQEIFVGYLAKSVKRGRPCYLQLLSLVFPSFDSFLYQPGMSESPFSHLITLQVTIAATHPIQAKGLRDLQTSLKPAILTYLRPAVEKKMVIVLLSQRLCGGSLQISRAILGRED